MTGAVSEPSADVLSPEEVLEALRALTPVDHGMLEKAGRIMCYGTLHEPLDLVQMAVERVLEDVRACPRSLPIAVVLRGAMRSIADAERRKRLRQGRHESLNDDDHQKGLASPARTAEERLLAREDYELRGQALTQMFEGDEDAMFIIMGDMDGIPADEIREMAGMDRTKYASTRRRVRRRIENRFPAGWQI